MLNRSAIHFKLTLVSVRSRWAILSFSGSAFGNVLGTSTPHHFALDGVGESGHCAGDEKESVAHGRQRCRS